MLTKFGADIVVEVPATVDMGSPRGAVTNDLLALPGGGFTIAWTYRDLDQLNPSTDFKFRSYGVTGAAETTILHSPQALSVRASLALTSPTTVGVFSSTGAIEMREFNTTGGAPIDGPLSIIPNTAVLPVFGDAIGIGGGKTLMVYRAEVDGFDQLHARPFSAANVGGTAVKLSPSSTNDQFSPAMALLTNGKVAVGFSITSATDTGNIGAFIISDTGARVAGPTTVNQVVAGQQNNVRIAALTSGGFVVTWIDHTGGSNGDNVKARIYDNDGVAVSKEFAVHTALAGNQFNADVTGLSGGRFAVVWENDKVGEGQIVAQVYDRLGNAIGTQTLIVQSKNLDWFQSPRIETRADGKLIVALTNDKREEGIIVKIFDPGKTGTAGNDTLTGAVVGRVIEGLAGNDTLTGTNFADKLDGGIGKDTLNGGAGNDSLDGGTLADVLNGGLGKDTLKGGTGNDFFVFNVALTAANVDRITDFVVAADTIRLENAVMRGLGTKTGVLGVEKFWKSSTGLAHDTDDRIIYETDTGKLFYDADGLGGAARQQIATLAPNLALTKLDFHII
ncbi:MAG TPA: calcium-binding protein [Rhizobiaceae bacterium]|nr:calcium-binding protein [Rhizobiaceae bacterium]